MRPLFFHRPTQPVSDGKAHPDARGAAKKPMAETSKRRLVDNMRSVLLSAAAHINGDPGIPQDEKTALMAAWDAEYRTAISRHYSKK